MCREPTQNNLAADSEDGGASRDLAACAVERERVATFAKEWRLWSARPDGLPGPGLGALARELGLLDSDDSGVEYGFWKAQSHTPVDVLPSDGMQARWRRVGLPRTTGPDRRLTVEQQAHQLLGEEIGYRFAADQDAIEDCTGVYIEQQLGVEVHG
jgi:hypothetical protein